MKEVIKELIRLQWEYYGEVEKLYQLNQNSNETIFHIAYVKGILAGLDYAMTIVKSQEYYNKKGSK